MKATGERAAVAGAVSLARVGPALLRDRDAAAFLGRGASWIRAFRVADVKAMREGRAPSGPKWIAVGSSIFYRPADLEAWIAANAIERGVVAFSNRGKSA